MVKFFVGCSILLALLLFWVGFFRFCFRVVPRFTIIAFLVLVLRLVTLCYVISQRFLRFVLIMNGYQLLLIRWRVKHVVHYLVYCTYFLVMHVQLVRAVLTASARHNILVE